MKLFGLRKEQPHIMAKKIWAQEPPLRRELFGLTQLEDHARHLAAQHTRIINGGRNQLLERLAENEAVLSDYNSNTRQAEATRQVTPAAEWLLDNFYLIAEQIDLARRHLPRSYSRTLPQLPERHHGGSPRVYQLSLELISHTDGQVDAIRLERFMTAYQEQRVLNIGELWAIPIMLRLALIENLRRLSVQLAQNRHERNLADFWATQTLNAIEQDPDSLIVVVAEMARSAPPLTSAFAAELNLRLQGQHPATKMALAWMEQRFATEGLHLSQLIQAESQKQATHQVSVSNSITSLRLLSAISWRDFVEQMSRVEMILRQDPGAVYPGMAFETRDQYRHAVEAQARRFALTETTVAEEAILLAQQARNSTAGERRLHVGFYLIDDGQSELFEKLAKKPLAKHPRPHLKRSTQFFIYLVGIAACSLLGAFAATYFTPLSSGARVIFFILALTTTSRLAVSLVNWLTAMLKAPCALPRMEDTLPIAPSNRTLVVVPVLLQQQSLSNLLAALELRFLANRDENLGFALLSDFADAASEQLPEDNPLLLSARKGIEELNHRYQKGRAPPFYLLHRPRIWNAGERRWMGRERKRGKLADLNRLLRNRGNAFSEIVGETVFLDAVRYVIVLDGDTQLPIGTARKLVATLAHPLNAPEVDPVTRTVCKGHGILQPRIVSDLASIRSHFAHLSSPEAGVDPYTRAVSDVYQDLCNEGSFIGKGIYHVDTCEEILGGRFPANSILSHDLLEGCYARSGLDSATQLFEDHPSSYLVDVSRRCRWIRGDWQISPWLLPSVPTANGRVANPLSWLSRWKIFDNLRRGVVPIAAFAILMIAWNTPGLDGFYWTLYILAIYLIPAVWAVLPKLCAPPPDTPIHLHGRKVFRDSIHQLKFTLFELTILPFEAAIHLTTIIRTLWRMSVSHTRLLEWQTSSDAERNAEVSWSSFQRSMAVGPLLAAMAVLLHLFEGREPSLLQGTLFIAWLGSPTLAWWISKPWRRRELPLTQEQITFLRIVARKTWRFFETFVTREENWLPPDNFQQEPLGVVAARTSPTNIGLGLLSNLGAYDMGYLSMQELVEATQKSFTTLQRMERHRGHFFNWYDTRSLAPLPPRYISTVDSGNCSAHLLTLRSGLLQLQVAQVHSPAAFDGIVDTLRILQDAALPSSPSRIPIQAELDNLLFDLQKKKGNLLDSRAFLLRLRVLSRSLLENVEPSASPEVRWWMRSFDQLSRAHIEELEHLAPWLSIAFAPEALWQMEGLTPEQISRLTRLRHELEKLNRSATLADIAGLQEELLPLVIEVLATFETASPNILEPRQAWLLEFYNHLTRASAHASERLKILRSLAEECQALALADYKFLHDPMRNLLSIGFNLDLHRTDQSFYDLLASEARLASYLAISQGQLTQEHWFSLGRILTLAGGKPALVSWSGSMFEYLMPLLVMPNCKNSLLDQTYRAVVQHQVDYGKQHGVPWGVSESCYHATDRHQNYQYHAFGVPGLGLKRGLARDLVIAPYASAMALMVEPFVACLNLERLAKEEQLGLYGFYEAIDYTPSRLPPGQRSATVRSFMAHHQGMSLLSIVNALRREPMQSRFQADPAMRAIGLLLQEKTTPDAITLRQHLPSPDLFAPRSSSETGNMRIFTKPTQQTPEINLLSNGNYQSMVTVAGGGVSRWKELTLTRWREDSTRDCWGNFIYLRDLENGTFWSNAYQPVRRTGASHEIIFTQGRAEFRTQYLDIDSHTEISVSPEDDIELRRITLTNTSRLRRSIEITSYAEAVLGTAAMDAAHPAFSNLFIQTELVHERSGLLCTRRPRSSEETSPWLFNMMIVDGSELGKVSFETDRSKFIGRGQNTSSPASMSQAGKLSNSQGAVLDPILSIRRAVELEPGASATIDIFLGVAPDREDAIRMMDKYDNPGMGKRVMDLAWAHSQVTLRQLNISEAEGQLYARLAGGVLYPSHQKRPHASVLLHNRQGQRALWRHGISGDLPIVSVSISSAEMLDLVRQSLQAHSWWKTKGLKVDLVIMLEDRSGYRQPLYQDVMGLISASGESAGIDRPGSIYVRKMEEMTSEDRILLQSVARVSLNGDNGSFAEQVERRTLVEPPQPELEVRWRPTSSLPIEEPRRELILHNSLGGFTPDGREYILKLEPGRNTPAPWVNVLANPQFGTVVSESGGGYTWMENSHEFRLTPWSNDPVSDVSGEALYIRDEQSGHFWSPTPLPARRGGSYTVRHGFGYTVFEHQNQEISSELWIYVAIDANVKFLSLKLTNRSNRKRSLSATGYWEWVLGELREKNAMHIVTQIDPATGALCAQNFFNSEFPGRIAFVDVSESEKTVTGDRSEFLGRTGSTASPAAMRRTRLSGKVGAALDPCAAMQVKFDLLPNETRTIVFRLGSVTSPEALQPLVERFRKPHSNQEALSAVWKYWSETLGTLHVETPDPSLNLLANGWLLYQTLSCRFWGRTSLYQSGGAIGFRDQLQDAMALVYAQPGLARQHILDCAAHQFGEGDVQHWWHPPGNRGVQTHFSDDYLWLPYVVAHYVKSTRDIGILDENVAFLEGRPLRPDEEAHYDQPVRSGETATIYEHCLRAIRRGQRSGVHGLPLMGCGDWNDGMNRVGHEGLGESVWLGFFLRAVLKEFSELAQERQDVEWIHECTQWSGKLASTIEEHAWDGEWYLRAFFDNGKPLGSRTDAECQIDSIAQSWAVLSMTGSPERQQMAMESAYRRLVTQDSKLIRLFDPPFVRSSPDPGYIQGYPAGVRENGGQYNHAAIWFVMAWAEMGQSDRAWELFKMLNPVLRSATPRDLERYRLEPYVIAADIYTVGPHLGRGGWSWYTGSAGWMYRLIVETFLGIRRRGQSLVFTPRPPSAWKEYQIHYRHGSTFYHIVFRPAAEPDTELKLTLDNVPQKGSTLELRDDGQPHQALVEYPRVYERAETFASAT